MSGPAETVSTSCPQAAAADTTGEVAAGVVTADEVTAVAAAPTTTDSD